MKNFREFLNKMLEKKIITIGEIVKHTKVSYDVIYRYVKGNDIKASSLEDLWNAVLSILKEKENLLHIYLEKIRKNSLFSKEKI